MSEINTNNNVIRFIIGSLDIGGTETHLVRILPVLLSETFKPVVITLTHKGKLARHLQATGIPVYEPPSYVRFVQKIPGLRRIVGPPLTICYLISMYIRTPARLTCFYLPAAYILGMMASIALGDVDKTVMFRRSLNIYQKKRPIARLIERRLHKLTGAFAGNSQAVIRQLVEEEGVPASKVSLIYNGVDLSSFRSSVDHAVLRNKFGIGKNVVVLTIVANLIPYKGHVDLINALAMIADKTEVPWLLLCVGSGIEQRPDLKNLVDRNNLADRIRWMGQRDDVPDILSISDIGLLVSHQEGFSNAVLEGMAAGLPMIVTDIGGNPEAIIHGESGIVVPAGNPHALADAIFGLINDRETARQYGLSARTRVHSIFSINACTESYKKLFSRMMTG